MCTFRKKKICFYSTYSSFLVINVIRERLYAHPVLPTRKTQGPRQRSALRRVISPHKAVALSLLGPNIRFIAPFSCFRSPSYCQRGQHQVPHREKTKNIFYTNVQFAQKTVSHSIVQFRSLTAPAH